MKNLLLVSFVLLITDFSLAQSDNKITLGNIDSIQSTILNEKRQIWVHVPREGQGEVYSKQKYPVIYLLDGDAHFYSVVGMIHQLSEINGNTICPEMIVVGIPNTDRTRDLTPTHVDADQPFMDSGFSKSSGGGEKFAAFLEKELIPYIESKYPVEPYKILIGHSFGGLTAINILINHTRLFNAYISIDPSMWWDKDQYLKLAKQKLAEKKYAGTALYIGIANTMDDGMDVNKVIHDTSAGTRHIRSILSLDKYLKAQTQNGLRYSGKYYSNDDHGSVPLIAEYDGLRFIFDSYRFKLSFSDYNDESSILADKIERHYQKISQMMGYKVNAPEDQINGFGYQFLAQKKYSKAERFFKMNVINYPQSANAYDSYGDYFEAIGDKQGAIENYTKSLSIKEVGATREKLDRLMK
ncbi:alpha/beta hydrolase-fold protein [Pollutibacter soli]|uniref:alpha/beta hydrolase-fold protein n=1 Tax=Pollutibacter soli TaxID=3034157 RepID=UPI0030134979